MLFSNDISTSIEQERRARMEEETRQCRVKSSSFVTALLCALVSVYLLFNTNITLRDSTLGHLHEEPGIVYEDNGATPPTASVDPTSPAQGVAETMSTQQTELPATSFSSSSSSSSSTSTTAATTFETAVESTTTTVATTQVISTEEVATTLATASATATTAESSTTATTVATTQVSSTEEVATISETTTASATTAVSLFENNTNPETGFPSLTSVDDWTSIQTTCSKEYAGCAVYVMENSGMGSALFGVFKHKIMQRVLGRPYYIVDESRYPYYRSEDSSMGVLTTFFTPTFPIIDERGSYHFIDEILPEGQSMKGMKVKKPKYSAYQATYTEASPIITLRRPDNRREMDPYFLGGDFTEEDLWRIFAKEMCPNLRYNEDTREKVNAVKADRGFPNFLEPDTSSVAFHVRRTDKVDQAESIAFSGERYVAKLLEAQPNADPQHCYVATDDATTVAEIEAALRQAGLTCQIWDLPNNQKAGGKEGKFIRSTYMQSLVFLAELSMMVEATHFVGSWDSNVGVLATVLRGCPEYGRQEIPMGDSYHVDDNEFMHSPYAARM